MDAIRGIIVSTPVLVGVPIGLLVLYLLKRKEKRYPPGPFSLPILGNFPQLALSGSIIKFCEFYKKRFGNAFTIELGGNKRVVISGYEEIHRLLIKNAEHTSNRSVKSMPESFQRKAAKTPGIFWAPFPLWKTLRSFALVHLKEDGMGKAALETEILEEIDEYINYFIQPNLGKPISTRHSLLQATSNIISHLMLSTRIDYADEKFNKMVDSMDEAVALTLRAGVLQNMPFNKYLLKSTVRRMALLREFGYLAVIESYIDEHKQTMDPGNSRDLFDAYFLSDWKENPNTESNAGAIANQLFVAGAETTSTALQWALLFMLLHPEAKEKVHREIEEQIGLDRAVTFKDHLKMPYTDAVLLETLRIGNIVSTSLPHTLEKDMIIDGKMVPAGADLLLNMASVLNDETVFEEPEKFKPERYLTGNIALKRQRTIVYGIGQRTCLGESLAKVEFFLFFVSLLQKYDVHLPDNAMITSESVSTAVNSPKPYDIVFTARC